MVAGGGGAKASVHHDSQSNDGVGSGKGSETICFLGVGAQPEPRGFLTAGSSEFDSDKRLFCGRGGEGEESSVVGVVDEEGNLEGLGIRSGGGALNCVKRHSLPNKEEMLLTNDVFEAGVTLYGV